MLVLLCSTALTGAMVLAVAPMTTANAQALYGATGGQPSPNSGVGGSVAEDGHDGYTDPDTNGGSGGAAGTAANRDGGHGGDGDTAGGGGGGYSPVINGNISADSTGGHGGDGGRATIGFVVGGGGGGAGGDGARNDEATPDIHIQATVRGGNGGHGGGSLTGSGASGGGGAGFVLENSGTVTLDTGARALGGNGGGGVYGGGGGAGIVLDKGGALNAQTGTTITGGSAGDYGTGGAGVISGAGANLANSGEITGGAGGQVAPGGAGISIASGGSVLNDGTIRGGTGGAGGSSGYSGLTGGTGSGGAPGFQSNVPILGDGGVGIVGANLVVMNAGTIAGGTGFNGQANAITFTGGDNSLFLRNGSTIIGSVVVENGATGRLGLGIMRIPTAPSTFRRSSTPQRPARPTNLSASQVLSKRAQYRDPDRHGRAELGHRAGNAGWRYQQPWRQCHFHGAGRTAGVTFDQGFDGTYAGTIARSDGVDGGSFTKQGAGTLRLTGSADLGTGLATVSEGTLDVAGALKSSKGVIDYTGSDPGAAAAVEVDGAGATWTNAADIVVGNNGVGSLEISNGGTVTSNEAGIGVGAGSSGAVTVTGQGSTWNYGGLFLLARTVPVRCSWLTEHNWLATTLGGVLGFGANSTGTVKVSGVGSSWSDNLVIVGGEGDGDLTVSDGGTVKATGGAVALAAAAGSTGTLNIGAGAGQDAVAAGMVDATAVQFGDGDGTVVFNHTGTDYVFAASLQKWPDGTGAGTHSIDHLAGNTRLTGDSSTFDGTTTVSGGKLSVSGALGGIVNVEADGTLGGTGTVGTTESTTTIADGGHIAPGNSVGTLTVAGNLALSSGSILDYELGSPGASAGAPGTSDRIDVAGDLTLDGTLNLAQSGNAGDGAAGLGYYRVMTYGGTLTDNGLDIGTTPVSGNYEIQAGAGNIDLFIAASGDDTLQHWQGGDGTWDAANEQWLNQGSPDPVAWAGNHAVFKNEPGGFNGGTISVAGTQSFKGLQFVDNGFRLEGPGMLDVDGSDRADGNAEIRVLANATAHIATTIAGTGGISKTEGGTLVLSGNNTYQGGTRVFGGTLSVSSDANLGAASGALTLDGGTLQVTGATYRTTARDIVLDDNGGGFDIADPDNVFTVSRGITGSGSLTKTGAGLLRLASASTYGGGTTVSQGALVAMVTGSLGAGPVIVHGNGNGAELHFAGSANSDGLAIKVAGLGSAVIFRDNASAGTATIDNDGRVFWHDTASAGSATIDPVAVFRSTADRPPELRKSRSRGAEDLNSMARRPPEAPPSRIMAA
ncbi:hypothetical protein HED49_16875 [Ochrobactrum daejeonense]|nr:hypothetical protein [Brucella daejeonensis]